MNYAEFIRTIEKYIEKQADDNFFQIDDKTFLIRLTQENYRDDGWGNLILIQFMAQSPIDKGLRSIRIELKWGDELTQGVLDWIYEHISYELFEQSLVLNDDIINELWRDMRSRIIMRDDFISWHCVTQKNSVLYWNDKASLKCD